MLGGNLLAAVAVASLARLADDHWAGRTVGLAKVP
jgi:hypothetical protein